MVDMDAADPYPPLPDPPSHVTNEEDQDIRLIRAMLALSPADRLRTLANWSRLTATRPDSAHAPTVDL
jgi:hypothetical protein